MRYFSAMLVLVVCVFSTSANAYVKGREYVVLMHSLRTSSDSMKPLVRALEKNGYDIVTLEYPEEDIKLPVFLKHIHEQIEESVPHGAKTSFVGFAMGAVIMRAYLDEYRPTYLSRAVMLAAPQRFRPPSGFLEDEDLRHAFYGTRKQKRYDDVYYTLGVLAGDRTQDPPSGIEDVLTIEKTSVAGMRDHLILHGVHAFLVRSKAAQQQTIYFLEHGKFERPKRVNY